MELPCCQALNQAIEQYEKAIQITPRAAGIYSNEGLAYYNLGLYQMKRGEDPSESFRKSAERHRKALEINPKNYPAHVNLGNAYLHLGKHLAR